MRLLLALLLAASASAQVGMHMVMGGVPAAAPTISYIGSQNGDASSAMSVTLISPLTSAAGDTIVCAVGHNVAETPAITSPDPAGNTYTACPNTGVNGTNNGNLDVFVAKNVAASTTNHITATWATSSSGAITCGDYRGPNASTPVDGNGVAVGQLANTTITSPSFTPTAGDAAIGFVYESASGATFINSGGFLVRNQGQSQLGLFDLIGTTGSSQTGVLDGSQTAWASIAVCNLKH